VNEVKLGLDDTRFNLTLTFTTYSILFYFYLTICQVSAFQHDCFPRTKPHCINNSLICHTSPLETLIPRYISPNEPLPILRISRYFPLTRNSDFEDELVLLLAIVWLPAQLSVIVFQHNKHHLLANELLLLAYYPSSTFVVAQCRLATTSRRVARCFSRIPHTTLQKTAQNPPTRIK